MRLNRRAISVHDLESFTSFGSVTLAVNGSLILNAFPRAFTAHRLVDMINAQGHIGLVGHEIVRIAEFV